MRMLGLAVALALVGAAACGKDDPVTTVAIGGTYALQSIGGVPVPVTIQQDANVRTEITAGSMTVNEGGTFSSSTTYRQTSTSTQSTDVITCTGTYTRSGNTLTLVESSTGSTLCGGTYTASAATDRISVTVEGVTAVFRK